jgi:hypothetical protein
MVVAALVLTGGAGAGSATRASAPSGPPVVTLHLVGGTGITGPVTPSIVHCAFPTLQGAEILVIGSPADATLSVRLDVRRGQVMVGLDTGSGPQYEERGFLGRQVTHFDAGRGATIDTSLTPVPPPAGTAVPNLPAISSIAGTISCGGQTAGSSTLRITGTTETGRVTGPIHPVSVSCKPGSPALIIGLVKVGHAKALIDMSIGSGPFSFAVITSPSSEHEYQGSAGAGSLTAGGASVNGSATEAAAAGVTTVHTLHVVGHVTCGHDSGS